MNLRESCIQEALAIIETSGIEKLSLREVSRRLGVSHQAPYKHFPSRNHILAEVVSRTFKAFATHLDNRPPTDDPYADLGAMGQAYLRYALENPLQYRLMFGIPLPDPQQHPEMMQNARHAFSLLRDGIARLNLDSDPELDALFVWSTIHGLASIMHTQVVDTISLPDGVLEAATTHVLQRIGVALNEAAR